MGKKLKVAFVGAGNLASAITAALHNAGVEITEIISRNRPESRRRAGQVARKVGAAARTFDKAGFDADVIWICVSDDAIADVAGLLANKREWNGKIVLHASGALSSDELAPLRKRGAAVGSLHPMMSFVRNVHPQLVGVTFAAEGDDVALKICRRLVRLLRGTFLTISRKDKALYHAWGAFCSPLIIAELAIAERIAKHIGISPEQARKTAAPILRRTLENYIKNGPAGAFSGPIRRGDTGTITGHLKALKKVPEARELYISLVRAALRELPSENKRGLEAIIANADLPNEE